MNITEKNYLLLFLDFVTKSNQKISSHSWSSNNINTYGLPKYIKISSQLSIHDREIKNFKELFLKLIEKESLDFIIKNHQIDENLSFFEYYQKNHQTEKERKDFFQLSLKFYDRKIQQLFHKIIKLNDEDFLCYTNQLHNFTGRKAPKMTSEEILKRLWKTDSQNQEKYISSFIKIVKYFNNHIKDIQNQIWIENIIKDKIDSSFYSKIESNTKIKIHFEKDEKDHFDSKILKTLTLKFEKENLYKNIFFEKIINGDRSNSTTNYNRFVDSLNNFIMKKKDELNIESIYIKEMLASNDGLTVYFDIKENCNINELKGVYQYLMLKTCSNYMLDYTKKDMNNSLFEKTWNLYWLDKKLSIKNEQNTKSSKLKI
jgi:hypothetical protein